jgi:(1->4)-alpha-D-glucan 1-alpha-D-glucosylmutase
VDFELRARMVRQGRELSAADVMREWDSGLPKLWLIARVLALRHERPGEFSARSKYQPLVAQGAHLGNLLAFRRGENLIAAVPRFTLSVNGNWGDTRLPLPRGVWRNHFTGALVEGVVSPSELLSAFPVALLIREK